jgi:hypothetical protein
VAPKRKSHRRGRNVGYLDGGRVPVEAPRHPAADLAARWGGQMYPAGSDDLTAALPVATASDYCTVMGARVGLSQGEPTKVTTYALSHWRPSPRRITLRIPLCSRIRAPAGLFLPSGDATAGNPRSNVRSYAKLYMCACQDAALGRSGKRCSAQSANRLATVHTCKIGEHHDSSNRDS